MHFPGLRRHSFQTALRLFFSTTVCVACLPMQSPADGALVGAFRRQGIAFVYIQEGEDYLTRIFFPL